MARWLERALCRALILGFKSQYCWYMHKYLDQISSATMLVIKRSVGVTPGVNLRNPLHGGQNTCKQGDPPRANITTSMFKTGISEV